MTSPENGWAKRGTRKKLEYRSTKGCWEAPLVELEEWYMRQRGGTSGGQGEGTCKAEANGPTPGLRTFEDRRRPESEASHGNRRGHIRPQKKKEGNDVRRKGREKEP